MKSLYVLSDFEDDLEIKKELQYQAYNLAKICLDMLLIENLPQKIVTSNSIPISINQVVNKICEIFDYDNLICDTS